MSQWQMEPEQIQGVLQRTVDAQEHLLEAITEETLAEIGANTQWAGGSMLMGMYPHVPEAVGAVFTSQRQNLETIGNRINAGITGVGNAVIAYNHSHEDMIGNFQREMFSSAADGDFSYFAENGYQG